MGLVLMGYLYLITIELKRGNKMNLKLTEIETNKIIPYENNSKEHPEWQISQIMKSIEAFGFNDPIAINENFMIIEGHGRYLAAKELNMEKIPCIILTGMSDEQIRAYTIAHNKLCMNTDFDLEKLRYEMNALTVENFDITLTGFSQIELEDINKTLDCGKLRLSETYEDKNKEIDLEDEEFKDFSHCCPRCGFEFN